MSSQNQNAHILITDADVPIGAATVRELMMPRRSEGSAHADPRKRYFDLVVAGVHSKAHPGDLRDMGAKLVQVEERPNVQHCSEILRENDIDEVYLVTEYARNPLETGRAWIEACKKSNVQCVLMFSIMGCEGHQSGQSGQTGDAQEMMRKYSQLENELQNSGIQNWCILRCGMLQQAFFACSDMIKKKRMLGMPVKQNCKAAPVNLMDVASMAAHILAFEERSKSRKTHRGQIYKCTGNQSMTMQQMCECLNRAIGGGQGGQNIKYEEVDNQSMERYLRECMKLDEVEIRCFMVMCELLRNDRLDTVSHDIKKVTGSEPRSLEEFFREHRFIFAPQQQQRQ